MLAIKPRITVALRLFLIAVISFNALVPTTATAMSNPGGNEVDSDVSLPIHPIGLKG